MTGIKRLLHFTQFAGLALLTAGSFSAGSFSVVQAEPSNLNNSQSSAPTTLGIESTASKAFSLGVEKSRNASKLHAIEKLDLGNFNLFHGNTRQAIDAYKLTLQINHNQWEAHWGLCNCYVRQHKIDLAIQECQEVLALKPRHKDATLLLANLLKSRGQLVQSIQCFEAAKALGVNTVGLYTALGLALAQSGKLEEATVNLDKAIAMSKKGTNADAHLGKAVVSYKQGNKQQALIQLDKAIKDHGGTYTQARNFKAEILCDLGRLDEAKKEYLTEIGKEDPGPSCFQALGNIYLKEGNLGESLKIFAQGKKWYPRDAEIELGLGATLEKQKRFDDAIKSYRRAIILLHDKNKIAVWKKHLQDLEALALQQRAYP
jgi:tetratricopeptide (TPR) repeat protein